MKFQIPLVFRRFGIHGQDRGEQSTFDRYERLQQSELTARLLGIGVPSLTIWLVYGKPLPFIGFVIYLGALVLMRRQVAKLWQHGWNDAIYRDATRLQVFLTCLSTGVALWLAAQTETPLMMAGLALILGKIIHGLTASNRGSSLIRIDNQINTLTLIAIGFVMLDPEASLIDNAVIILVAIALVAYFHVAAKDTMSDRDRVQAAAKAGLNAKGQDAIGRLAGGFAHDFNNLLTTILGNLELYNAARSTYEERTAIAAARQAAERGAQLTGQLLSVTGRALMQPDRLNLPDYLADLRPVTARLFGPEVTFQFETAPDLPAIIVDRNQLTGALIQLLINARDAMPNGGVIMLDATSAKGETTASGTTSSATDFVQIDIYDEGTGISPADLPRVTEPFFTTRKFGEATGLGLSVAKGFAEQSGGSLSIHSELGKGTRVRLLLPVAPAATARQIEQEATTKQADHDVSISAPERDQDPAPIASAK